MLLSLDTLRKLKTRKMSIDWVKTAAAGRLKRGKPTIAQQDDLAVIARIMTSNLFEYMRMIICIFISLT